MGAYENALKYAQETLAVRKADRLVSARPGPFSPGLLANITAAAMPAGSPGSIGGRRENDRLARGAFEGLLHGQVPRGRWPGPGSYWAGNGIVADYNVARFFTDAEALYTYEGTFSNAEPHSWQGHYRSQRFRVSPF